MKDRALRTIDRHHAIDPLRRLRCASPPPPPFGAEDCGCAPGAFGFTARRKPGALRICHASQERLNEATVARPPLGEDGARSASEGGGCVSAMSSDSKRPKKQRPANAQRPPPSAALRFAEIGSAPGRGWWLRSRGVWVHGATQARSASGLPCKPEALRVCHASQERLNEATAARPPLGEDGARSASEGGGCVSAMSSDSKRPKKQRPANAQGPPPSAALRFAATSPLRGGGLWLRSLGVRVRSTTLARSASGLPCKPEALRVCHASQERLNEATVARPPLGEDGARSASEGGCCIGNAPPKTIAGVAQRPHS